MPPGSSRTKVKVGSSAQGFSRRRGGNGCESQPAGCCPEGPSLRGPPSPTLRVLETSSSRLQRRTSQERGHRGC